MILFYMPEYHAVAKQPKPDLPATVTGFQAMLILYRH
jgi:hypothetical protein